MALTNYILQNLIAVAFLFGYGLGLMGQVRFAAIPFIALAILGVRWAFSALLIGRPFRAKIVDYPSNKAVSADKACFILRLSAILS